MSHDFTIFTLDFWLTSPTVSTEWILNSFTHWITHCEYSQSQKSKIKRTDIIPARRRGLFSGNLPAMYCSFCRFLRVGTANSCFMRFKVVCYLCLRILVCNFVCVLTLASLIFRNILFLTKFCSSCPFLPCMFLISTSVLYCVLNPRMRNVNSDLKFSSNAGLRKIKFS